MIKIIPKLTDSDIVNKEVLRILTNIDGFIMNEICNIFCIPHESYHYYKNLTPLIKMDLDLKEKNNLRNKAYKIALDAMEMHLTLIKMHDISRKLNNDLSDRHMTTLTTQFSKLNKKKYALSFLVEKYIIEDFTLNYKIQQMEDNMEILKLQVKEVLAEYMGRALGKKEQGEIYKRIKNLTWSSPYEYDFSTVYRSCVACGLKTEYYNTNLDEWSILIIFDSEDKRKEGLIDLNKKIND